MIIYSEDPNFKPIEIGTELELEYIHVGDKKLRWFLYQFCINLKGREEKLEPAISVYPDIAYLYAYRLNERWVDLGKPEVEDIIGKDPYSACYYAINILKKKWKDIGKEWIEENLPRDTNYGRIYNTTFDFVDKYYVYPFRTS